MLATALQWPGGAREIETREGSSRNYFFFLGAGLDAFLGVLQQAIDSSFGGQCSTAAEQNQRFLGMVIRISGG
jgi:hypothetical protein